MEKRSVLKKDIIETCSAIGLLIKQSSEADKLLEYQHAPISLFPTPYPRHIYEKVLGYQEPLGILVSKLVQKPKLIHELLAGFLQYDDFLARLVKVSKKYHAYEDR